MEPKRALILMVLLVSADASAECDVSTDEAAAKAYQKATGKELPDKHRCIARSQTFPGVVRIGSFAYDRGCMWEDTIYFCKVADKKTHKKAMAAAGWKAGDKTKQQQLVLAWVREVVRHEVVDEDRGGMFAAGNKAFSPPVVGVTKTGVTVTYWSQLPSGDSPETRFVRWIAKFDKNGVQTGTIQRSDSYTTREN